MMESPGFDAAMAVFNCDAFAAVRTVWAAVVYISKKAIPAISSFCFIRKYDFPERFKSDFICQAVLKKGNKTPARQRNDRFPGTDWHTPSDKRTNSFFY
jgi:hypothetical protein